ncbi:MAG: hypothetical protein ACOC2D_14125 [Spirochaetota bacterium]
MLRAIEDVLDAEQEAERIVEEARQEASRLRAECSEEENRSLREAQGEADRRVRERIAEIREEQNRRIDAARERLRAERRSFAPQAVPGFDRAVARLVAVVTTGPQGVDGGAPVGIDGEDG